MTQTGIVFLLENRAGDGGVEEDAVVVTQQQCRDVEPGSEAAKDAAVFQDELSGLLGGDKFRSASRGFHSLLSP